MFIMDAFAISRHLLFVITLFSIVGAIYGAARAVLIDHGCIDLNENPGAVKNPYFQDILSYSKYIYLNNSKRVQLSTGFINYQHQDHYYCKVGFATRDTGLRVLLSWENFDVGEERNGQDWFQIVDMQSGLPLSPKLWGVSGKSTGNVRPPSTHDYNSIGHGLTLHYMGHPYNDHFSLVLTIFKDVNENTCSPNYYKCNGLRPICIARELLCNGEENCSEQNESDENDCATNPWIKKKVKQEMQSSTPVGLIGALLGILVTALLMACIALLIIWYKRKKRRVRRGCVQHVQSIASLAEGNRVPAPSNTYTHLPVHHFKPNPSSTLPNGLNRQLRDFSARNETTPIMTDALSTEILLPSSSHQDPHSTRHTVKNGGSRTTGYTQLSTTESAEFDTYGLLNFVDSHSGYEHIS